MSKSVRYSINGQYFADFGVSVIRSEGFGALKRKPVTKFEWPEYHGVSLDLEKPRFEERVIRLECNIIAENWELLYQNFQRMMAELQKAGTQRLLVEPFGFKALVYEIFMPDEAELDKRFVPGKSGAKFRLQLVEPNPIKKVLYFTGDKLDLSFNSPSETEIFYGDGTKDVAAGDVVVAGRAVGLAVKSGYAFAGRNYARQSFFNKDFGATDTYVAETRFTIREAGLYTLSFKGFITQHPIYFALTLLSGTVLQGEALWTNQIDSFTYHFGPGEYIIKTAATGVFHLDWITVTKGDQGATEWAPAAEDERYIIIAGNIEEITNLQTNATVLWERL